MRTTLSRICLAGLVCAVAFAILPLNAAEERPEDEQLMAIVYPIADIPTYFCGSKEFKPTLLIAYLKSAIAPNSWERGSITKHKTTQSLVIWQTLANHRQIAEILTSLRPPADPREEVEVNGVIRTFPPNPAQPDR